MEDAAHAAGAWYDGRPIGASTARPSRQRRGGIQFYATKNLTTGEGGMLTTGQAADCGGVRSLRCTAPVSDAWDRYTEHGDGTMTSSPTATNTTSAISSRPWESISFASWTICGRRTRNAAMYHRSSTAGMTWSCRPIAPVPPCLAPLRSSAQSGWARDRPRRIRSLPAPERHWNQHPFHADSAPFLFRPIAAGCLRVPARPGTVSPDRFAPLYPGLTDDSNTIRRSVREVLAKVRPSRFVAAGPIDSALSARGGRPLHERNHMNTHHIDVWLERICQLIAVALSFTAAFYLRFDFAIPASARCRSFSTHSCRRLGETAGLRLGRLLPRSAAFRQHSGFVPGLSRKRDRLAVVRGGDRVLARAGNAAVHFGHRRRVLLCGHGTGPLLRSHLSTRLSANDSGKARTGILDLWRRSRGVELVREIHSNRCTRYR